MARTEEQRAHAREYKRKRYAEDPAYREAVKAAARERVARQLESPEVLERKRAYMRGYSAEQRKDPAHREFMRTYHRAWLKTPAGRAAHCAASSHRRALKRQSTGKHTTTERRTLFAQYAGLCAYCLDLATTADHVIALSRGGSNGIENLVPACKPCNDSKKSTSLLVWLSKGGRHGS